MMTPEQLAADNDLRFIQRVLESDAPKEDRERAAEMCRRLRTALYRLSRPLNEVAQPAGKEQSNG